MNQKEIASVALKILGIYVLILGLSSISAPLGFPGIDGLNFLSFLVSTLTYILSGLILIFKAESISNILLRSDDQLLEKIDVSENFQKASLRVLGVYVAVFAIPSLVHLAMETIHYQILSSSVPEHLQQKPNYIIPLVSQALRFLIGVYLALGADSVIKVLGRFDKTIEKMNT
jgi:hypothetical protein